MNILHYALGFPPYRTGGLTTFCVDLMSQQISEGHDVALLWPGEMSFVSKNASIKYKDKVNGVVNFEIINPLPISYDEGIVDIDWFMNYGDRCVFEKFLNENSYDVIHIHTLMGLHKAFLDATCSQGIKTVYTAHDFFPICPKVTMFRHNSICKSAASCAECPQCNVTALAKWKIRLLQSPVYRNLKDSALVKRLRKQHRDSYLNVDEEDSCPKTSSTTPDDYKRLRNHYLSMLEQINVIHCNSSVTVQVYRRYLPDGEMVKLPITHSQIGNHIRKKNFTDYLRLTYLGPQGGSKGFFLLKAALDDMWKTRNNFELNVFFEPTEISPYMNVHERYSYGELDHIFENSDLLIAPSICYETFGFTVLEALSYGVPVLISENVGAKDIIPNGAGIELKDMMKETLMNEVLSITPEILSLMNLNIIKNMKVMTMENMSENIHVQIYGI